MGSSATASRGAASTELNGLPTEIVVDSVRGDWTDYYRNVAAALQGHAELAVKPEEVRRAIAIFDAAMLSAKTGEAVRVRA